MERQNNEHLDTLSEQVAMLKSLTMEIDAEVKDQNSFLENMGISFVGAGEVKLSWSKDDDLTSLCLLRAGARRHHAGLGINVQTRRTQTSRVDHFWNYRPISVHMENHESSFSRKHVTPVATRQS